MGGVIALFFFLPCCPWLQFNQPLLPPTMGVHVNNVPPQKHGFASKLNVHVGMVGRYCSWWAIPHEWVAGPCEIMPLNGDMLGSFVSTESPFVCNVSAFSFLKPRSEAHVRDETPGANGIGNAFVPFAPFVHKYYCTVIISVACDDGNPVIMVSFNVDFDSH